MKHSRATKVICLAIVLDVLSGIGFSFAENLSLAKGFYWAITTATTVGYGDISPHTVVGHVVAVLVMLTVIPLFAASFSLVTSGLTANHVHDEGVKSRKLLGHIILHHPDIPNLPKGDLS